MTDAATPTLPRTPPIPGFYFRPYRGEEDLLPLVELLRAADEANGEEMVASIDRLRVHYRNMTRIDPTRDVILGFVDDRLVAHSFIEWADTAYGERHFNSLGSIHPDWRRRGIGGAMMARNETRLLEIVTAQNRDGTPVLTTWMQDLDLGAIALAKQRGYEHARVYHHMVCPTLDDITVLPL
ncbi:MAG: GNAT family N-acetyltransferase, partial [Chloroflexota bacterium]|nr:GNAT family N-acetyltransferase [Chloroflexota bacterium]